MRYGGHRAWRAGTRFENELVRDRFVEVWGVGGGFGFGPAGPGRVYWYCFETVPEGAPAPERPRDEFVRRHGAWFDPIPALIASTDPDAIEPTFTYDRPPRRTWSRGLVTLLGDAAHPMKPNIGQGAAQALEDAVVLGLCLAGSDEPEKAFGRTSTGACGGRTPSSAPLVKPDVPPRSAPPLVRKCEMSSGRRSLTASRLQSSDESQSFGSSLGPTGARALHAVPSLLGLHRLRRCAGESLGCLHPHAKVCAKFSGRTECPLAPGEHAAPAAFAQYALVEADAAISLELRSVPIDAAALEQAGLRSGMPYQGWWAAGLARRVARRNARAAPDRTEVTDADLLASS